MAFRVLGFCWLQGQAQGMKMNQPRHQHAPFKAGGVEEGLQVDCLCHHVLFERASYPQRGNGLINCHS